VGRTVAVATGLIGGVALAGICIGILLPMAPDTWRSEPLAWGLSALLVAFSVMTVVRASRSRRE